VLPVLIAGFGGCTAFELASRGAPPEEMRVFEVELSSVNLDASTEAAEGAGYSVTTDDHALASHDHNAPDHDLQEHIAFMEMQGSGHADPAMAPVHRGVETQPYRTVFPESGWIHGFDYEVVDSSGGALPNEVLHHLQVLVPDRRELFAPLMLRVAGAGGETSATSLPQEVGYRVTAGDSVAFTAMLHNPTGRPLGDVRLRIRLRYSPEARTWRAPADVVPFFSHVTAPLEDTSYDLPPGRSEKSLYVRPAVSGTILAMGGHLHRYGVALRFEDAETGRVLWETRAQQAPDGTVLEVPQTVLVWRGSFDVVAGHPYRVTAVYDNPSGMVIPGGAMGTVGGVIRPEGDWPSVDRSSQEYRWDVERMLR